MYRFTILIVVVLFVTGCGSSSRPKDLPPLHSCVITVMQDGKPLADARVTLVPEAGHWNATGSSDTAGVAEMFTSGSYQGVPEGKYRVCVMKIETLAGKPSEDDSKPGEPDRNFNLVDPQYSDTLESPLYIGVVKGTKEYKIDVGKAVKIPLL
ncbi:MAG: hypothetical protein LBJ00_18725 [Planctomycetaceae bacterium]|jgi:hypothetical protein|nr:hypothetical protein [Planctomycetaceae bacterium]